MKCLKCNEYIYDLRNYKEHLQSRKHNITSDIELQEIIDTTPQEKKRYKCEHCHEHFSTKHYLLERHNCRISDILNEKKGLPIFLEKKPINNSSVDNSNNIINSNNTTTNSINIKNKKELVNETIEQIVLETLTFIHYNEQYPENHNLLILDNEDCPYQIKVENTWVRTNNMPIIYIHMLKIKTYIIMSLTKYMKAHNKEKEFSVIISEFVKSLENINQDY